MTVAFGQIVTFTRPTISVIGTLQGDRVGGELLCGTYNPGSGYKTVRPISDASDVADEAFALSTVGDYG